MGAYFYLFSFFMCVSGVWVLFAAEFGAGLLRGPRVPPLRVPGTPRWGETAPSRRWFGRGRLRPRGDGARCSLRIEPPHRGFTGELCPDWGAAGPPWVCGGSFLGEPRCFVPVERGGNGVSPIPGPGSGAMRRVRSVAAPGALREGFQGRERRECEGCLVAGEFKHGNGWGRRRTRRGVIPKMCEEGLGGVS